MEELRKQCMAWLEQTNPLRGLSISRAGSIYDMARKFGSPRLQYAYNEIEKTDPVVFVCCDRRESALAGLEWSFVPRAHADENLAKEQADALTKFADNIENFGELLTHLDGAFFRGYAHAQPIWDGKAVSHVNLLDSWNFLTDPDGRWYWNPACHETPSGLDTVDGAQLVSLTRRRSIDYPILFIYIRKALGERDYGRFIERHGIPHAAIIMAPGTEDKDKAKYIAAANAWNNGQDIALPNASDIKLATEARGTDPFTPFVEHQDKYTVLLATGATLTSLAQADTGSLAGGAHMEVWREIVARDGVKISEAMNRDLFRRYLELEFPGRPMAAKFVISNDKKATASEVADLAGKLKTAGYSIDQEELQEAVGFTLVKDELPADRSAGGMNLEQLSSLIYPLKAAGYTIQKPTLEHATGLKLDEVQDPTAQPAAPIANKEQPRTAAVSAAGAGKPGADKPDAGDAAAEDGGSTAILSAFAKDMSPAGKAVAELLKDPSKEAAEALLAKLDTLLPEDPAMTAVIAEAMAKEFGAATKESNREYKRETDGKFSEVDNPTDFKPGKNPDSAETQAAEIGKGKKAIERCLSEKCDIPNAVSRGDVGLISLVYTTGGDDPRGMIHFLERPEAREHLAETLVRGEAIGPYNKGQKLNLKHGGYVATLRLTSDEKAGFPRNWVLSGYGPNDKKEGAN